MRLARSLLALALASGLTTAARADRFQPTRSELLVEVHPRLDVTFDHGFATVVIERSAHNGGVESGQGVWVLSLPRGGVAVGLRTLGTVRGEPHWWTGDLLDAEVAAERYRTLTSLGGYTPKDPALLSWRSSGEVVLQAFPFPPREDKSVEVTALVPTEWRHGREILELGAAPSSSPVELTVRAAHDGDVLRVDGTLVQPGARLSLSRAAEVSLERDVGSPAELGLSAIELSKGRAAVRWQLRAPVELSPKPVDARLVLVLDASRSMRDEERDAEIAAAQALLAELPDASVEIVTFHRTAAPLLGRFTPATEAARALPGIALSRQNGSRLERGLGLADELLAGEPDDRPRRVVVLTDLLTARSLTPAVAAASLTRSHALVHVGVIHAGTPHLSRLDSSPWSSLTRPTGGLVWTAFASSGDLASGEMRRVYEEWAHPIAIDHLRLSAAGIDEDQLFAPGRLLAGDAAESVLIARQAPEEVRAEGELWAEPMRARAATDAAETTRWSALIFGSSLVGELRDAEMRTLAARGGAVSPVSSYLAIEPGTRPSTEGLARGRLGGSHRSRAPQIRMGATQISFEREELAHLRREVGDAWRACGGGGRRVTVDVETTRDEIVDVGVRPGRATAAEVICLEEAVWAMVLPALFRDTRATFGVTVPYEE